jgi:hypothetical protein
MNWKNVLHLVSVDMKSSRLIRGQKLTHYTGTRHRLFNGLLYGGTTAIGLTIGLLIGLAINVPLKNDANFEVSINQGFSNLLLSLPTLILVISLIFTTLQQIQRSGTQLVHQSPYWLPITWQEQTLASILTASLGFPTLALAFTASAVIVFSAFVGQIIPAIGAVLAMAAAVFTASATTEAFRIVQVRFTGAIYKSTGRAAVWVRFAGSLLFFVVFYFIYFYITSGSGWVVFIQQVASIQSATWFVPFVWLGMTLYSLMNSLLLEGLAFLILSILFLTGLFLLGVALNKRFGLYEPPAITISRGIYTPKTGLLGKLGFTSIEAALIRKDLKAFTRRRELIGAFIIPIVFLILPIMSSLNGGPASEASIPSTFWFAFTSILPVSLMAMSLGNFLTGEEGQNIWQIYAAPISAKNFARSKYAFLLFFALIVLPITGTIGYVIYRPTFTTVVTMVTESVFIALAAGALSLANGIKGADFSEIPRPRMIRSSWSIINLATCFAVAFAVLLPLLPNIISSFVGIQIGTFLELYQAVIISGVIAAVLTALFYSMAVANARELLAKAEI